MDSPSGYLSPRPVCQTYRLVDPPLSTKREAAMARATPARSRPPPLPRLTRTAPVYSRVRPNLDTEKYPAIVSFKPPNESPQLSPLYNANTGVSYFEQCFEIEGSLGHGSFGEVFRVRSKEDGRHYAVKCALELYRNMADRKMKTREVQKHELLPRHPNLVGFVKAWEEKHRLYIQTELCERSLENIAREQHELDETFLWNIFVDALLGLYHLHSHDLLHVDIKPENIFVSRDGVCKLGDFGLIFDVNRDDPSTAREGDSKYLAMEVLNDKPTKAADIFSLGITLFELATDIVLPSSGDRWRELRQGIIPDRFVKSMPPEFSRLVLQMMHPNPTQRPTARELLNDPVIAPYINIRKTSLWTLQMKDALRKCFATIYSFLLYIIHALFVPFENGTELLKGIGKSKPCATPDKEHLCKVPQPFHREPTPDSTHFDFPRGPDRSTLRSLRARNIHIFDHQLSDEENAGSAYGNRSSLPSTILSSRGSPQNMLNFSASTYSTPSPPKARGSAVRVNSGLSSSSKKRRIEDDYDDCSLPPSPVSTYSSASRLVFDDDEDMAQGENKSIRSVLTLSPRCSPTTPSRGRPRRLDFGELSKWEETEPPTTPKAKKPKRRATPTLCDNENSDEENPPSRNLRSRTRSASKKSTPER